MDRITGFAKEFDSDIVLPLDVADDAQIFALAETLKNTWGTLDGVVHSIGFAPREAIQGDFLDGLSRDGFKTALDISAYSFPALVKALVPLMEGHPSSVLTLTYLGSERVVPNYNTMGVAKAALEASVRYLANSLGPKGIRAQRYFFRSDQDAGCQRHQGFLQDSEIHGDLRSAQTHGHDRRSRQYGSLPALRLRFRYHGR